MRKLNHIFLACCLLLAGMATSISMQAQDKTPITVDGCRPLLAPDCVIDDIVEEVEVIGVPEHIDYTNVLDLDLENSTKIPIAVADAGVLYEPIISIRDINHKYKGGQAAGFVVGSGFQLLGAEVLKSMFIVLYNDNELVKAIPVNDGNFGLLSLSLLSKKSSNTLFVDVPSKTDDGEDLIFDEIMLATSGINLSVLDQPEIYYGFIGSQETRLSGDGYTSDHKELLIDQENGYTNWGIIGLISGPIDAWIQLPDTQYGLPNVETGFVYSSTGLLNTSFKKTITFYNTETRESEKHYAESGLGIDIVSGTKIRISAVPQMKWNKVKIEVGGLSVASVPTLYYAYTKPMDIPSSAQKHRLNLSSDALLCENETEYTLTSDVNVTWSLKQVLDLDGETDKTEDYKSGVTIDPTTLTKSAKVTFATPAAAGIYIFEARDEDGCTGTVTLTRGKTQEMEDASASWFCGNILNKEADKVHLENPKGGALISIDKLNNAENILDGNLSTYASYAKGLQLAAHTGIVSVKKDEGTFGEDASVVGFVAETPNSLLGADVLKFYNIVLYKDGKQVYSSVVSENNTVQAALLGAPGSAKVRYAIEVPQKYVGQFDEFTLFTSGVLNLDLTGKSLKIYGAFVSDDQTCIKPSDPLDHLGVTSITSQNTGATFNYNKTGNAGLVEAVTVLANLGYLLDGTSLTDDGADKGAVSYAVANILGSTDITVKTGRKFSGKRWVGFVIKVPTGIGDVSLLTDMEIKAYNNGKLVGDSESGSFLSANLIGWTDYAYVSCYTDQPFDEVTFTNKKLIEALKTVQYLGFYTYADKDGDGIPDEEDPDFCEPPIDIEWRKPEIAADMNSLCASNEKEKLSVMITAENATQLYYTLTNVDKAELVTSGFWDTETPGIFSPSIDFEALQMEAGRYKLEVSVVGQTLLLPASKIFVIHAEQTTWAPKANSTDWNVWENWTNGVPVIGCTDVVIPGQSAVFPVLKAYDNGAGSEERPADFNSCEGLHFDLGAEMLGSQHLDYKKAWVELELSLNRYYMLSAPLKGMYTGDFFVPQDMNGTQNNPYFTDLDETTSPDYRFGPRVYQRLWECSAPVVNGATDANNGNGSTVQVDETRWTPPFNALAQSYEEGEGFSLKAGKENLPVTKVRFRFPKEHTKYFYYNEDGFKTDLFETLDRTDNGRLFTDGITWPLVLNYTLETESNTFLVGNPFMAHINIGKFLKENSNVTSVKVYDGNAANSLILCDGKLLTNGADEDWTSIAPMQSFFVTFSAPAKTAQISITEDMLETKAGGDQPLRIAPQADALNEKDELMIEACADSTTACAKVVFNNTSEAAYVPGEDAVLLVDDEVKPRVVVYTMADDRAVDIQQTPDADRISIGVAMSKAAPLTLKFTGRAISQWKLYDAQTRHLYDLSVSDSVSLGRVDCNAGRFTLVKAGTEDKLNLENQGLLVSRTAPGAITVASADQLPIKHCAVYAADGHLISQWEGEAMSVEGIKAEAGVNMVRAIKSDGSSYSQKVICY